MRPTIELKIPLAVALKVSFGKDQPCETEVAAH